jgi:membrane protein implicated in regulation of membrane protease activity
VEDISGKCQLWDILFYSFHFDPALEGARFCSMGAMLVGMAMLTTMLQAQQAHLVSWGVGAALVILLVVSLATSSIFNIWIIFWLFTYVILTLIVRAMFVHPVHRRISNRGSQYIGSLFILCSIFSILTLVVLRSDYCTCKSLSTTELEDRIRGDPCDGECRLGAAGYVTMFAAFFWLATAIVTYKFGIQKKEIRQDPKKTNLHYTGYSKYSITTRAVKAALRVGGATRAMSNSFGSSQHGAQEQVDLEEVDVVKTDADNTANRDTLLLEGGGEQDSQDDEHDLEQISTTAASLAVVGDDEDDETDNRKRLKKFCCDYRVEERSKMERWLFWSFRITLGFFFGLYLFVIILMIGSRAENRRAEQAPDTSPYFITESVCAFDADEPSLAFQTFSSADTARSEGLTVGHCGECGYCSNIEDIETYVLTRKTIANLAKKCGPKALIGKYGDLVKCLEDRIGFSRECTFCWAENMKSTAKECLFTCMKTLFTGFMSNNNVQGAGDEGWLNQCLYCDEKLSGPAFVTCSGVARRRLGIVSEIERNPEHQCPLLDLDWLEYFGTT